MSCGVIESWSSCDERRDKAYDVWVERLMQAQGSEWTPSVRPKGAFNASIRHKVIDEINIIEIQCDPCSGYHSAWHAAQTDKHIFLTYLKGREDIQFGREHYSLTAGDTFFWDSSQPTRWEVISPLHKIALAIPTQILGSDLRRIINLLPRKFDRTSGSGFLLNSLINTMAKPEFTSAEVESRMILNTVSALVSGAKISETIANQSLRTRQIQEIKRYILYNLRDPRLSVSWIAKAHRISKRYLHWLFKDEELTVNEFIISRRLEGCHSDLQNSDFSALNVSQIAYHWGFENLSHFSKRCRSRFGEPPSSTKKRSLEVRVTS